jgi:hypothetical protein
VKQGTSLSGTSEQHSAHLNINTPQQPDKAAAVIDESRPVPCFLQAVGQGNGSGTSALDRQRGRCGPGCVKAAMGTLDVPASSAQSEFNYLSHMLRKNGFISVW